MDRNEVFSRIVAAYEAGELVPMCAWCGRVRIEGEWVLPPAAALAAIDERNTLSHSICDDCAANRSSQAETAPSDQPNAG
ncbi:MAG TPA: hypothetical protein VNY33_03415 [Gaiellaceae bacterium]|nr:hypothetical protein [Gaiellaceae bacterium]